MEPEPSPERDLTGPALFGVLVGMTAAIALEVCDALPGVFQDVDPFLFVIVALAVFGLAGAAMFVGLAVLRGRLRHWSGRRKRS